jgi:hypothetical protein
MRPIYKHCEPVSGTKVTDEGGRQTRTGVQELHCRNTHPLLIGVFNSYVWLSIPRVILEDTDTAISCVRGSVLYVQWAGNLIESRLGPGTGGR